jgi:hypothetical protein
VAIAGPVIIGDDFGPQMAPDEPRLTLLEGKIDVFGRARPPWWLSKLGLSGADFDETLYPATSMSLPAGSRLRDCDGYAGWWGFADAQLFAPKDEKPSILLALTTDAHRLALTTLGGVKATSRAGRPCASDIMIEKKDQIHEKNGQQKTSRSSSDDIIEISFITRMLADPYFSLTWVFCGFLIVVIQTVAALLSIPQSDPPRDRSAK